MATLNNVLTLALALASACVATGCAGVEDVEEFELAGPSDDAKADSIAGKKLEFIETEEIEVGAPGTYEGTFSVNVINDIIMEVSGPSLHIDAAPDQRVQISVEATRSLDLFTDYQFIVQVAEDGGPYTIVELKGSGLFGAFDINFFNWIEFDPEDQEMTLEFAGSAETVPFDAPRDLEYRIVVFPKSGWGDLTGDYAFTLRVD